MKRLTQAFLSAVGITEVSHPFVLYYQQFRRRVRGVDEQLRRDYLRNGDQPKLHVGSSNHLLDGWLNTDLFPSNGVMKLDATQPYPFETETFQFVYSEHMIEHVPYEQGLQMLSECYRVLRKGGWVRIVTPDLAKIMNVYPKSTNVQTAEYLEWMANTFTPGVIDNREAFVINAFFRMWGHQFIYDQACLTQSLQRCGFVNIQRHQLGHSQHVELQGLENVGRYPAGLLNFESLSLEATK